MNDCNCAKSDLTLLDAALKEFPQEPGSLVPILQRTQELYGYLPTDALYRVADAIGLTPAAVLGVATFYTQFRTTPVGKYLILLCKGTACYVNGASLIEKAISEHLHIKDGETTGDGLFTLKSVACIGCCCLAPAMMINGKTYGHLTPGYALSIINELSAKEGMEW